VLSDLSKKSYLISVNWLKSDIMDLVGVLVIICGVFSFFLFFIFII
jgi:hypothetical protein